MKKFLLMTLIVLSVASTCLAADTKNITKEINTAENFAQTVFNITSEDDSYQKLTKNFNNNLKATFSEQKFQSLKKTLGTRCGKLTNLNFKLIQRESQGDIVLFTANTQKARQILINLYFDKEGKVLNYGIGSAK